MKSKIKYFTGTLVAVLAIVLVWRHFHTSSFTNFSANNFVNGKKTISSGAPAVANPTASSNATVKVVLQSLFDNLKKMGALQEVQPISKQIQDAIDSRDVGKIMRAFHDALYYQGSKMSEAIPALKGYLNDANPWIRFQAAEDLYIAGDNSGCDALISILQTGHPIRDFNGSDLRIQVAKLLEKYRERRAINALEDYCRNIGILSVKNSGLAVLDGLALTARGSLPDDLAKIIKNNSDSIYVMYNLSFVNPQTIKDYSQTVFEESKDGSGAKIHAAWALLKAGERDPYYSYLMAFAKNALAGETPLSASPSDPYRFSLKILSSIQDPAMKSMLEGALDCKNAQVVEIALVNLFFNQGGSEKAKQYLLSQFHGPTNLLADSDFDMQLAAAINDPQINAAAQSVDDRTETSRWAYFEDRKNWSVYTWIGDYVVDLNGSRQIP